MSGNGYRAGLDGDLAVLVAVRREAGLTGAMTLGEIAECVGCSRQNLHKIEQRALGKVRARMLKQVNFEELRV